MSANQKLQKNAGYDLFLNMNECSVISFILAVVLFIMAPITLNFNVNLWSEGPVAGQTYIPMHLAYPGGILSVILIMIVSLTSIVLGIKGIAMAFQKGLSKVLPGTALLVSFVSFILWIIVALDLIFILDAFRFVSY